MKPIDTDKKAENDGQKDIEAGKETENAASAEHEKIDFSKVMVDPHITAGAKLY